MRKVILLTVGALLALGPCALGQQSDAAKAIALYKQGLRAIEQGQVDTARECFQEVIRLQPRNMNARYQLKQLSIRSGFLHAKKRELKMKEVRLPVVNFDDLSLPEALDAINALVRKQTDNKFSPNFVVQDPNNVLEARKFTLKLGNLPASVVLQYCLDSSRATARYDQHAIVIRPLGGGKVIPQGGEQAPPKIAPKKSDDPFR